MSEGVGRELVALVAAVESSQTRYRLASGAKSGAVSGEHEPRARFVLGEIQSVMEWFCDDGVENEDDATLATIRQEHASDPDTRAALAEEVVEWAGFAETHRDEIDGLAGFNAVLLDEVPALASALRGGQTAGTKAQSTATDAQVAALSERNLLAAVLYERMRRVRAAARAVFRAEPEAVREVTSSYQRKRRAVARLAAHKKAKPKPTP